MCGISCSYKSAGYCNKRLLQRGPDFQSSIKICEGEISLSAFILNVQGNCPQPCYKEGVYLIYNGQYLSNFHDSHESDTQLVLDKLVNDGPIQTMSNFKGPHAIVAYFEKENEIWFWRDYFGRRSLLITKHCQGFVLSSVGDPSFGQWIEVPSQAIYCFKVNEGKLVYYQYNQAMFVDNSKFLELFKNPESSSRFLKVPISDLNKTLELKEFPIESIITKFLALLSSSVSIRAKCCLQKLQISPSLLKMIEERHCHCTSDNTCPFHNLDTDLQGTGSLIGVLYSGGIDCTLIAYLLHQCIPPEESIDLLTVAFGHYETTPDRISAKASLADLRRSCPGRKFNLVMVDVSLVELQVLRERHIRDLVYPHNTVLDDSIGCALWFAARGIGIVETVEGSEGSLTYSTARVVFSGLGADELLGGYSRHRGAWENTGMPGLTEELERDINRISERNLGRDNRVVGDHGRDYFTPYLDTDFVSYVNSLPLSCKMKFELPRGHGEKWILRRVAEEVGLTSSSVLPKRAIQFGSKIAKLEGRKEKGKDVCKRLLS